MALSQDRYISIKSTNVGDSAVQQRELGGLAFTLGKGWKKTDEPWDDGMKVIIYGATQARNYFVDGSAEIEEAERYFSYISPSGTAPSSLTYVKMSVKAAESADEYAVVASFSKMTSSEIKEVSVTKSDFLTKIGKPKNATYSFEYQNTSWTYGGNNINLSDYGITVTCDPTSGTPASGDVIKVVVSNQLVYMDLGVKSELIPATESTLTGHSVNPTVCTSKVGTDGGTYSFKYQGDSWKYNSNPVEIAEYGISISGVPSDNDEIKVVVRKSGWYKIGGESAAVANPIVETPNAALHRVNADSNNFGSYNFIDLDQFTCGQFKDVAISNCGFNYKYHFCVACVDGQTTDAGDDVKMNKVSTASFKAYLKAKAGEVDEEFVSDDGIKGTAVINGCDVFSATMPMATFASTDYSGVNTPTNFMLKQFAGETPTVTSDDVADQFDKANINYYGLVQVNGQRKSFFQTGVNSDGESMAVYCNEIWLKSVISTAIMNLFLTTEKIPANADGELMIYGILMSAAEQGVRNGMILRGKRLTDEQKVKVYQLTGNSEAWFTVQDTGYVGSVEIRQKDKKYVAYYKLIYSKGDAICKVEGSDILI